MKRLLIFLLLSILFVSCKQEKNIPSKNILNNSLILELEQMVEIDQIAAYKPEGKYKELSPDEWAIFKDSVFTVHTKRLQEMFSKHGFLGYNIVGEEGSSNFWLMVQHSDSNVEFQKEVLKEMYIEVKKDNADSKNYGMLTDRVSINSGGKQIYGTQLMYNTEISQAYPKPIVDSLSVNDRRKDIGLEPIEEYLNWMSQAHCK